MAIMSTKTSVIVGGLAVGAIVLLLTLSPSSGRPAASSPPPAATATTAVPTVASTATPPPAPTPKPEPLVLTGSGQSVAGPFPLKTGLARIAMTSSGTRNFIVKLMDDQGKTVELLANQIGAWEGEKAVRVEKAGSHLIDVAASGAWTITITQ